ncbi:MAG: hypothetical protein R3F28_15225 [Candidatus Kapaibacterium sp.]
MLLSKQDTRLSSIVSKGRFQRKLPRSSGVIERRLDWVVQQW